MARFLVQHRLAVGAAAMLVAVAIVLGVVLTRAEAPPASPGAGADAGAGTTSIPATAGGTDVGASPGVGLTNVVTNAYFPLRPGMRWVYRGSDGEDGTERVVVEVLAETRIVAGVPCVVVRDVVSVDGEVVEDTRDWYAQDSAGNVWYMGEAVKDLDHGVVVSTQGSWEAGVDGAEPGIIMPAHPSPGPPYRQEYYRGEAEDMGQVLSVTATVRTPFGAFDHVVQTRDYSPLEPGVVEHKLYARGVGMVAAAVVAGGTGKVDLVEFTQR